MKFIIYNLGCKVNSYESNVMTENLENAGYILTDKVEDAAIAIVNTCSVTNTADSKSLKTLRQVKKNNPNIILIACGCLAQVNSKIIKEKTNADIIIGNIGKSKIVDIIKNYLRDKNSIEDIKDIMHSSFETMQLNNFDKTRAFVKIQDGCNNFCSYCIIPYTRGDVRSKKRKDVLSEIESLVSLGHKEIVLTGIHTGHYGSDLENYDFADLLSEIVKIKSLERVRISSIEITEIDDKVLDVIKSSKVIVDHIHIPLQSGCTKTLKDMNRKYDIEYFKNKIAKIRSIRPEISITTDVIVGFPGETEDDFKTTVENIKEINFSKIHVFPYSVRKGTKAEFMDNQVSENVKKERVKVLLELSKELEINYMNKFLNRKVIFIPEVFKDSYLIGHTGNYLLIKANGNKNLLNTDTSAIIKKIDYPYCIADICK